MSIAEIVQASPIDKRESFPLADPLPLLTPAEDPQPYPLEALSPLLREAVIAYQRYGKQPVALVASAALSAASLATQGLVDVARDRNLEGPISLNLLSVAKSGERKTSADRRMARAIRQWEADRRIEMKAEIGAAKSAVAAHAAEYEGLLAKIRSRGGKATSDRTDPEELKRQLAVLEQNSPAEAIAPSLFNEDVTPEKLAECVALGWPSTSLWSDEGGLVVGSHALSDDSALRFFALLNRLWDGQSFDRKRTTAKSFTIKGRRVTCSLMMQETVLYRLLAAGKGASRGTGFLARFLIAWPVSTIGSRLYEEADLDGPALAAYDARVRELLDLPLPTEGDGLFLRPPVLALSVQARGVWIGFHDKVERDLGKFSELENVVDFGAKAAENAARIAAVLHVVEHGPEGEISADFMNMGTRIAAWHLHEAQRIIGETESPVALVDARLLLDWLLRQPEESVDPRLILNRGPAPLRNRQRRDAAVERLIESNHLYETIQGGKRRLILNPKLGRTP